MNWVSFMTFWQMRELGQADATFRNYDLLWNVGKEYRSTPEQSTYLWLALKHLGLARKSRTETPWGVAEVAQRIVNMGGERPRNSQLVLRLIAWYNWHRIRSGEVQSFMLRSRSEGPTANLPDL